MFVAKVFAISSGQLLFSVPKQLMHVVMLERNCVNFCSVCLVITSSLSFILDLYLMLCVREV